MMDPESAELARLIALVDRLERLLDGSALAEIEVEAGGTTLTLRRPSAIAPVVLAAGPLAAAAPGAPAVAQPAAPQPAAPAPSGHHAVTAPLTGVFYGAPSPGAAAYVTVGGHVSAGQVIGLIEAMKLFNEIKSDVSGTVRRIGAESGALVKAKQVLIEVEPS